MVTSKWKKDKQMSYYDLEGSFADLDFRIS
jgi:hypothetical protein